MITITHHHDRPVIPSIRMGDLKPLEVAVITEAGAVYLGRYVMRTFVKGSVDVWLLDHETGDGWSCLRPGMGLMVRPLGPDESLTLQVSNTPGKE